MEWELHGGEGLMQKCPPSGGGEGRGYGYFLELHNAYLAGYRIEGGGGTFLGSEASTRVAKL